ncbi:cyclopropane-fatty-acyl-phospholipid synthase family protein [Deinococcus sp. RIT780]|uniref:SAM-dependent methyltransferase n=1 Tax=Deinococcus sp. RIT780 TaxID=2870472 RepID=UPI001C893E7D|nr:cyclopropane-fatty-acyl-phospholipid synthase family protein [Deinococcus sp. RIT780]MBX8464283.1 cyclopropane-fatty-acyl-phospholipid synthase family protein [Deinococcus sp. RIT780]
MSTTRRTARRSTLTWAALATAGAALIARQATRPAPTDTETLDATRTLLRAALPSVRPFDVQLWNGEVIAATRPSRARLILNSPETLGRLLKLPLDVALGEAYLRGDFEIEGNIGDIAAIAETFDATPNPADAPALLRAAATLRRRAGATPPIAVTASLEGPQHSRERDQQAISYHYDVSNDFYRLWLDRRMVYSCAYFRGGTETLDEAQEAKLDLICRKLRLQQGEHLLDIGSGWGGLAIHAAQRYGARVLGVTLSEAQLHEARARAGAAGVADRVTFELRDYRDVLAHTPEGSFDKIASVGMAEHVGRRNMPTYFRAAYAALKPGGLMMNHAISDGIPQARVPLWLQSGNFARRYVFPDGELLPIWETVKHATEAQFEVRDIENLREHYARTLTHWAANLETHHAEALAALGEQRHRLWRLYLGATSHYFEKGHLGLYQTLLAKPDEQRRAHVPLSRADLYEGEMVDG